MTAKIEEQEKPARIWQVNELTKKLDEIILAQDKLEALIKEQTSVYPTRTELALELKDRDSEIRYLKNKLDGYSKFIWLIATALVPTAITTIWQVLMNK